MPDVRLPDGTIVRNVPEGTTRAELSARLGIDPNTGSPNPDLAQVDSGLAGQVQNRGSNAIGDLMDRARSVQVPLPTRSEGDDSGFGAFAEMMGRRFVNNVLAIPSASGEALALGSGLAETTADSVSSMLTGREQEQGFGERFGEATERQRRNFPASALRAVPSPTVSDIVAGGQSAVRAGGNLLQGQPPNIGGEFDEALLQQQQRVAGLEDTFSGGLGETAGDVATLITGRAPLARRRATASRTQREQLERQFQQKIKLPDEIADELNDTFTKNIGPFLKKTAQNVGRGTGRTIEGGLEGATLALLQEGDPAAMFGLGAGAQAVGSAGLFLAEKPVKRLLPTVGISFVTHEMFKALAPGISQDFFESKDFAINMAVAGFAAGLTGALSGAGRLRGPMTEKYPVLFDAITAAPRGAVRSRLEELTNNAESGNDAPLRVMRQLATNPSSFSDNQQRALGRAIQSERAGAFTREVERLMRDSRDFRERVGQISEPR